MEQKKSRRLNGRTLFYFDVDLLISYLLAHKILPLLAKVKVKPESKCKRSVIHRDIFTVNNWCKCTTFFIETNKMKEKYQKSVVAPGYPFNFYK